MSNSKNKDSNKSKENNQSTSNSSIQDTYEVRCNLKYRDGNSATADFNLYVDDEIISKRSENGSYIIELSEGIHNIRVESKLYTSKVDIELSSDREIEMVLRPKENVKVVSPIEIGRLKRLTNKKFSKAIQNEGYLSVLEICGNRVELQHIPTNAKVYIDIIQDENKIHPYMYEVKVRYGGDKTDSEYRYDTEDDENVTLVYQDFNNPRKALLYAKNTIEDLTDFKSLMG